MIIVGILTVILLVHFDVIDNPINLIKGNEIKDIRFTTKSMEMRKEEVTHLEIENDNGELLEYKSVILIL